MVWDSEEELREAISDNQSIIDSNDDKVRELCKEKGRLECAKNTVYNHYLTYLDEIYYKDVFEEYRYGDKWKGETFNEFEKAIDGIINDSVYKLKNDLETCYLQMDEYIEKKQDKIDDLNWDSSIREGRIDRYETELALKF